MFKLLPWWDNRDDTIVMKVIALTLVWLTGRRHKCDNISVTTLVWHQCDDTSVTTLVWLHQFKDINVTTLVWLHRFNDINVTYSVWWHLCDETSVEHQCDDTSVATSVWWHKCDNTFVMSQPFFPGSGWQQERRVPMLEPQPFCWRHRRRPRQRPHQALWRKNPSSDVTAQEEPEHQQSWWSHQSGFLHQQSSSQPPWICVGWMGQYASGW